MKNLLLIILIFAIGLTSCEEFNSDKDQDFLFKIGDDLEYSYADIRLYDSSTHILYFTTNHPEFENCNQCSFSFYVDGDIIYQGSFWPSFLCSLPSGVIVSTCPFFYPAYTLRFEYYGGDEPDSRNDSRIISVLKENGYLHSGISISINSMEIDGSQLNFSFTVTNMDESDLLILDINKMGPNLFHYFTNGLVIFDLNNTVVFTSNIEHQAPSPWNTWKIDWLSKLKSGQSEQFTIDDTLDAPLNPGNYNAFFEFPGLGFQVDINELFQDDARIWLGDVRVTEKLTIL